MPASSPLHLGSVLTARPDGLSPYEEEGRMTLLHLASGRYYELTPVAAYIWSVLTATDAMSVSALCDRLVERYDVDRPTCEKEVLRLLAEMEAEGLVTTDG